MSAFQFHWNSLMFVTVCACAQCMFRCASVQLMMVVFVSIPPLMTCCFSPTPHAVVNGCNSLGQRTLAARVFEYFAGRTKPALAIHIRGEKPPFFGSCVCVCARACVWVRVHACVRACVGVWVPAGISYEVCLGKMPRLWCVDVQRQDLTCRWALFI